MLRLVRSLSTLALWAADKTVALTGQRRHLHKGAMVAPAFTAPVLAPHIQFGPTALAAAIARTATLRNAPPALLAHMKDSALSEAQILLADGPGFELSDLLSELADSERTHFASRVGAGITDLYMNALGYGWRDNAACLSSSLEPHADFLYHGGAALGHGVVLAEARGSFAAKASDAKMAAEAQRRGIPVQALGLLPQIGVPIAGLGSQTSGQSQGTQQMSGAQQFGTIASGIGNLLKFLPSDMRLKEDISTVGMLFDGTPVYGYRYKGAPAYHIGLMAQDVEKTTPEAVIEINGYKAVDYRAATEASRRIHGAG